MTSCLALTASAVAVLATALDRLAVGAARRAGVRPGGAWRGLGCPSADEARWLVGAIAATGALCMGDRVAVAAIVWSVLPLACASRYAVARHILSAPRGHRHRPPDPSRGRAGASATEAAGDL